MKVFNSTMFPHSPGLFYLAITQYLGFPKYGDEYKVMGVGRGHDLGRLRAHGGQRVDGRAGAAPRAGARQGRRARGLPRRHRGQRAARLRRGVPRHAERPAQAHGRDTPVPGGRLRHEQRGQRQDLRADAVHRCVRAAGRRRRGHGAGGGAVRQAHARRRPARLRDDQLVPGAGVRRRRNRGAAAGAQGALRAALARGAAGARRGHHRPRQGVGTDRWRSRQPAARDPRRRTASLVACVSS